MGKFFMVLVFCAIIPTFVFLGIKNKNDVKEQIEGVVVSVEYIASGSSFNSRDIKKTIVEFKDGRIKAFNGISDEIFQKGKVNVVIYNRKNEIISVKIEKMM